MAVVCEARITKVYHEGLIARAIRFPRRTAILAT